MPRFVPPLPPLLSGRLSPGRVRFSRTPPQPHSPECCGSAAVEMYGWKGCAGLVPGGIRWRCGTSVLCLTGFQNV